MVTEVAAPTQMAQHIGSQGLGLKQLIWLSQ